MTAANRLDVTVSGRRPARLTAAIAECSLRASHTRRFARSMAGKGLWRACALALQKWRRAGGGFVRCASGCRSRPPAATATSSDQRKLKAGVPDARLARTDQLPAAQVMPIGTPGAVPTFQTLEARGDRLPVQVSCRRGSRPATRSASRYACPSTATAGSRHRPACSYRRCQRNSRRCWKPQSMLWKDVSPLPCCRRKSTSSGRRWSSTSCR